MKRKLDKALALLAALAMLLTAFALADEVSMEGETALFVEGEDVFAQAVEPRVGDAQDGELEQDISGDDGEDATEGVVSVEGVALSEGDAAPEGVALSEGDAAPEEVALVDGAVVPEDEASLVEEGGAAAPEGVALVEGVPSIVTYCFIVGDTLVAEQAAREGDEILRPEDPEAPEGMIFAGWTLDDEFATPLFIDADGDGEIDPVIAHVDPLMPEVNVIARFEEIQNGEADQKPSPSGEGAPAGAEEVVSQDETDDAEETKKETTSTVTADAVPASQGSADPLSLESVHWTDSRALEPPKGEGIENAEEAQKPSPSGEGAPAGAEEVVSQDETDNAEEAEEAVPQDETNDAEQSGQKPSPDGEGGAERSDVTEEVSSPDNADTVDDTESEPAAQPIPASLTYTGEAQALVIPAGDHLYSLDGETFAPEVPTAVDAGEYTVYFRPADDSDAEPQTLAVTVAKADVVFTPPVAASVKD